MRALILVFVLLPCVDLSVATSQDPADESLIDFLSGQQARKRLDFSEKQEEDFKKLQKEYAEEWQGMNKDFFELQSNDIPTKAREELTRKIRIEAQKLRGKYGKKIKDLLVPRQFELISTLRFKQAIESFGFAYTVSNEPYADKLEITAEQKKELARIHQETQKTIQEKIKELKEEAKRKMVKIFDSKQRRLLRAMEGESGN